MGSFLQQIFELLTTPAGTLAYHLILALTIVGAFLVVFLYPPTRYREQAIQNRLYLGLGWLLALQFFLFFVLAITLRGLMDGDFWLPPIDRVVILFSLVAIVWMWCVPLPNKKADLVATLLIVFLAIAAFIGISWWKTQYPVLVFNGSWTDFLSQVIASLLLISGVIALVWLKPAEWIMGVIMLVLLALGHVLHLLIPFSDDQYSGLVRATQLAAFPFLYILAQRRQETAGSAIKGRWIEIEVKKKLPTNKEYDALIWSSIANLLEINQYDKGWQEASISLPRLFGADICLILTSQPSNQTTQVVCGYDLHASQMIGSHKFEDTQLPRISAAFKDRKKVIFPGNAEFPDLDILTSILNIKPGGNYIFSPVTGTNQQPVSAVLLGTPFSKRDWSEEEQSMLVGVAKILVQYFSRIQEISMMNDELIKSRQADSGIRSHLLRSEQDIPMSNELRLALEEISSLRASLLEYEKGKAIEKTTLDNEKPEIEKGNRLISLTQDIRQPLTSIVDYADILLSEQHGELGDKQKKYLERIRLSVDRINYLVNQLVQSSSIDHHMKNFSIHEIDLAALIQKIKDQYSDDLKQKSLSMRTEFPRPYVPIFSDKQALQTILDQIIQTSIQITPPMGKLSASVRLEHIEGSPDYALIQLESSGDLNRSDDSTQTSSPLDPDDSNFVNVRSLIEALGGKIWTDSEPGKGTSFSFYMPVIQPSLDPHKDDPVETGIS